MSSAMRSEERRVGKECRSRWARCQAEDGIRDWSVTGVQTCALPISPTSRCRRADIRMFALPLHSEVDRVVVGLTLAASFDLHQAGLFKFPDKFRNTGTAHSHVLSHEIGRASCRERV